MMTMTMTIIINYRHLSACNSNAFFGASFTAIKQESVKMEIFEIQSTRWLLIPEPVKGFTSMFLQLYCCRFRFDLRSTKLSHFEQLHGVVATTFAPC